MSDEAVTTAPAAPPTPIPSHPDPVAPVFFVSHATAYDHNADGPSDPNAVFAVFCQDLSQDLNQMVPRRAGADPGFIDRSSLRAGSPWEREILNAIGTCQVLVALVSEPFAGSVWCGKEWQAFTQRPTWRRSDGARMEDPQCALPVLWTANLQDAYPPVVMKRQTFRPRPTSQSQLDQLYLREGIYGMYRAEYNAYRATVWRIAQEIRLLVTTYWVDSLIPPDGTSLINAFAKGES
jgi:TIR domain